MFPFNTLLEKSLLPLDGKPIIRHIVDNLVKSETVKDLTITCLKKFKKNFEHEFRDVSIPTKIHSVYYPQGTFGTFTDTFNGHSGYDRAYNLSDYIMVHYADCFTNINYKDLVRQIETGKKADGIIAVTNNVRHDYSEVMLARRSKAVLKFSEKPTISNYTWSGIGLFHGMNMVREYKQGGDFAFDIFPQLIEKNKLNAYQYHGEWYDMGNLNSYRKVCSMFNGESTTKSSIC
jgi:NDP-sugar pyrophosphorylase family protein